MKIQLFTLYLGIPAEVYKVGNKTLRDKLFALMCRIWHEEQLPADLRDATIVTLFKKGNRSDCGNYRGISLLSTAGKILARLLQNRLSPVAEQILPESQCSFRPSRGTIEMIFAARQLQEKCIEQQKPLSWPSSTCLKPSTPSTVAAYGKSFLAMAARRSLSTSSDCSMTIRLLLFVLTACAQTPSRLKPESNRVVYWLPPCLHFSSVQC